jgi:hypothetical protein
MGVPPPPSAWFVLASGGVFPDKGTVTFVPGFQLLLPTYCLFQSFHLPQIPGHLQQLLPSLGQGMQCQLHSDI